MEAKKQRKGRKRVLVVGDLHCGHRAGLTPPEWQLNPNNEYDQKWLQIQQEQWDWYLKTIKRLKPVSLLLVVGDCVDGKSERAEGRDSIRQQRKEQVNMALTALDAVGAKDIEMVYGTRYHVRDWEEDVASSLDAKIGAHGFPTINGLVFDIKHKVGRSTIPHGRATPIKRARLWNALWAERNKQPNSDILLRGHVHYWEANPFVKAGPRIGWAMICPALQGMGSEYGAEQCEGLVDYGMLVFDVNDDGSYAWEPLLADLESHRADVSTY